MKLTERFWNFFNPAKIAELEKRLEKVEHPPDKVELTKRVEKLISKTLYNVNTGYISLVLSSGDVLDGKVTNEVYEQLMQCNDISCLLALLKPKVEVKEEDRDETKEKEIVSKLVDIFKGLDEFEVENGKVYLQGIKSIEIPTVIVGAFIEILDAPSSIDSENKFDSLLLFTYKLLLNPIEEAREDCLSFVRQFDIKLTNTGNMVMYRRINKVTKDTRLVEFISKSYLKVKSWKKSPSNYYIHEKEDGVFGFSNHEYTEFNDLGNLQELYTNLSQEEENRYTDNHTGTYDIRIGQVYKIEEKDIDLNKNGSCGGGLHISDGKVFDYQGFGDTPIVVLVDPRHIYKMDSGHSGKIACKQMFIAAVTSQDSEGNYEDIDNQQIVEFDEIYHCESVDELQVELSKKSFKKLSIAEEVPVLTIQEVQNVTNILKKRVVNV